MPLVIKLSLNDDIRRITFDKNPSFEELSQKIFSIYHISTFKLQYTDEEGDLITIGTDFELNEAITYTKDAKSNCLKIVISSPEEPNLLSSIVGVPNAAVPNLVNIISQPIIELINQSIQSLSISNAAALPQLKKPEFDEIESKRKLEEALKFMEEEEKEKQKYTCFEQTKKRIEEEQEAEERRKREVIIKFQIEKEVRDAEEKARLEWVRKKKEKEEENKEKQKYTCIEPQTKFQQLREAQRKLDEEKRLKEQEERRQQEEAERIRKFLEEQKMEEERQRIQEEQIRKEKEEKEEQIRLEREQLERKKYELLKKLEEEKKRLSEISHNNHDNDLGNANQNPLAFNKSLYSASLENCFIGTNNPSTNSPFLVVWTVKNNGLTPWPMGVTFRQSQHQSNVQLNYNWNIKALLVSEKTDIPVNVTIKNPGKYSVEFFLTDPSGKRFGDPCFVELHVKNPVPYIYLSSIESLHAMGFTDDDLNVSLLDNANGNLNEVINSLVEMSNNNN